MSSINQYYSPETTRTKQWWRRRSSSSRLQDQNPPIHPSSWQQSGFNLNNVDESIIDDEEEENDVVLEEEEDYSNTKEEEEAEEDDIDMMREAMFEKPLTPSDVGKLNRLVIPKQHAEKYFPLDSEENKGLLLSFEDESGKCWRFRYSYWNSSQSYVLTKGWSRYVKDKRLDAGDVVLFHRHRTHSQRFFITWRRRRRNRRHLTTTTTTTPNSHHITNNPDHSNSAPAAAVGGLWTTRGSFYPAYPTLHHPFTPYNNTTTSTLHAGGGSQQQVLLQGQKEENTTSGAGGNGGSSRVLRLFGVNMECQPPDTNNITINHSQTFTPESSYNINISSTTQGTPTPQFYYHHHPQPSSNPHHHMLR